MMPCHHMAAMAVNGLKLWNAATLPCWKWWNLLYLLLLGCKVLITSCIYVTKFGKSTISSCMKQLELLGLVRHCLKQRILYKYFMANFMRLYSILNPSLSKIMNLVASFKLNISCVKCAQMVDFPKFGHIYPCLSMLTALSKVSQCKLYHIYLRLSMINHNYLCSLVFILL